MLENINDLLGQLLPKKVKFNTRSGAIFIDPKEIVYIQAERNYTDIYLTNKKIITVSLYVSEVHQKLPQQMFMKISRSAYINREFITKLDRKRRVVYLVADGNQFSIKVGLKYLRDFEQLPS